MNFTELYSAVKFSLKKHSPEICIGAGIIGGITATVFACKATLKVDDVLAEAKEKIDRINTVKDDPDVDHRDAYTPEDAKKDKAIVYAQTALKLGKLYLPALAIGGTSIALILGGHKILNKRYLGIASAYATVDQAFKDYRERVKERFGDDVDFQLKNNVKAEEITEKHKDENGKTVTEKKIEHKSETGEYSEYARFFDAASPHWEKDAEYNLMFLRKIQAYFNDRFRAEKGVIFLNEVYRALGIPTTKAGQVIGWAWDPNRPFAENHIDFGIYNMKRAANRDFVDGYEPVILLDFNVDGNVWESMV